MTRLSFDEHERKKPKRRRWVLWVVVLVICAGTLLFFLYPSSSPAIQVDYIGRIDAKTRGIRLEQRAWPVYRAVLVSLTREDWKRIGEASRILHEKEAPPDWKRLDAVLSGYKEQLDQNREASLFPHVGFLFDDPADEDWRRSRRIDIADLVCPKNGLWGVRDDFLDGVNSCAQLLDLEARVALERKRADALGKELRIAGQLARSVESRLASPVSGHIVERSTKCQQSHNRRHTAHISRDLTSPSVPTPAGNTS